MTSVQTGIMRLKNEVALQEKFKGNIGVLCHSASIDSDYNHTLDILHSIYNNRLKKIYGPQHGFVTDVQDNMIETDHSIHPVYKIPIYSLYSETRIPTDEMLEGIDHLFIDLQDVGTRIYTYIYTTTYVLEACANKNIEVVILDRPNPIDANTIEGNILDPNFASFVGRHPIPVRHALTMAEVAKMHQKFWAKDKCDLTIIEMKNYKRTMNFWDTKLPYVNPSPNLPTIIGCYTFVGSVLFEGCNISEGRGTTRPLEIIGHPSFNPFTHKNEIEQIFKQLNLQGFTLREINFHPMFQKHAGKTCQGYHIHPTDLKLFKPWMIFQVLFKYMKQTLGDDFSYKQEAYEYETEMNPADMINGTDKLRTWYDKKNEWEFLLSFEKLGHDLYLDQRKQCLIYE